MTLKIAHRLMEKFKNIFIKIIETTLWRKLFSTQVDYKKFEEIKRETQIKYGIRYL